MPDVTAAHSRPDALADVPGVCDLPLTRAVVQYRDADELVRRSGRIRDIGMGVVLEGRYASSCRVIDLGSASVKQLDLSRELVILDWTYDPTTLHIRTLGEQAQRYPSLAARLRSYCMDLALRVLDRRGFTPLTRPVLLRIGFRDLCRDLDAHEGAVVRIVTGPDSITRVRLDCDANTLAFDTRTGAAGADPTGQDAAAHALAAALGECFRGLPVRRTRSDPGKRSAGRGGRWVHHVPFGVPVSFSELRRSLRVARRGLTELALRFEPERFATIGDWTSTFGERSTLDRLTFPRPEPAVASPVLGDAISSVH